MLLTREALKLPLCGWQHATLTPNGRGRWVFPLATLAFLGCDFHVVLNDTLILNSENESGKYSYAYIFRFGCCPGAELSLLTAYQGVQGRASSKHVSQGINNLQAHNSGSIYPTLALSLRHIRKEGRSDLQ